MEWDSKFTHLPAPVSGEPVPRAREPGPRRANASRGKLASGLTSAQEGTRFRGGWSREEMAKMKRPASQEAGQWVGWVARVLRRQQRALFQMPGCMGVRRRMRIVGHHYNRLI